MTIKSHKATGQVAYPFVLLDGPEGGGKSYAAAEFAGSERVGECYWFDLGEGTGEEYGPLGRGKINVIEHDGTYRDIYDQLRAVYAEGQRAHLNGEPPVVVVVDSITLLWNMLVDWTNQRAMRSRLGQRILAEDPDAEVDPTSNLWNDANDRHKAIINLLQTFPGPAIATARGKEVSIGPDGLPLKTGPVWKTEGQKFLPNDAKVIVRMFDAGQRAELHKAVTLRTEVRGENGRPRVLSPFSLDALIFDDLGVGANAPARVIPRLAGDRVSAVVLRIGEILNEAELKALWDEVKGGLTPAEWQVIREAVGERLEAIRSQAEDASEPAAAASSDVDRLRAAAEAAGAAGAEVDPTVEPGFTGDAEATKVPA